LLNKKCNYSVSWKWQLFYISYLHKGEAAEHSNRKCNIVLFLVHSLINIGYATLGSS
jgi:hypothetical protein